MLHHELGRLEAGRQVGMGRFLHHTRAGETDHALRLGDDDVPQRGEAGGDAAGGRMREDGDVGQTGLGMAGQGAAGLGHLHEAEDGLAQLVGTGADRLQLDHRHTLAA